MTKPKGVHATFQTECWACDAELTVTNGRVEPHDCRPQIIRELSTAEFQEALGDYYDSGAIGKPPNRYRTED